MPFQSQKAKSKAAAVTFDSLEDKQKKLHEDLQDFVEILSDSDDDEYKAFFFLCVRYLSL